MAHEQLSQRERYAIKRMKARGLSYAEMAIRLDRSKSTISREIERNKCPDGYYRAEVAHARAMRRRSNTRKKSQYSQQEWDAVDRCLEQQWSPKQVLGVMWLQGKRPMSYQTVYRHIHADRKAGGGLWSHMRHMGKYGRKRRGSPATRAGWRASGISVRGPGV